MKLSFIDIQNNIYCFDLKVMNMVSFVLEQTKKHEIAGNNINLLLYAI